MRQRHSDFQGSSRWPCLGTLSPQWTEKENHRDRNVETKSDRIDDSESYAGTAPRGPSGSSA
jgi:hypothetical protein